MSRYGGFRLGKYLLFNQWDNRKSQLITNTSIPKKISDIDYRNIQGIWSLNSTTQFKLDNTTIFIESVDFASTSTTITGPTIPSYVDDKHIGVLLEYTSSYSASSAVPDGWSVAGNDTLSGAVIRMCYKKLDVSDRGQVVGSLIGGSQRDQLFIFKVTNSIFSLSHENTQISSTTASLTSTAPTINRIQVAIAIHYFYNSTTSNPTVTSTPTMNLVRTTSELNIYGGQHLIYNPGETPVTQVAGGTFTGTIRQGLFWLVIS
jgi:hypothetical protein